MNNPMRLFLVVVVVSFALSVAIGARESKREYAMVNRQAPPFSGLLYDGSELDLASHLGKDLIVVHFWTTNGPSSQKALPVVAGLTDSLKDKGVVYITVNERQNAQEIKNFLDRTRLDIPVAMDLDGRIAKLYQVNNLPLAIVIGKDKKIHSAEPGFGKDLSAKLSATLESLSTESGDNHPKG